MINNSKMFDYIVLGVLVVLAVVMALRYTKQSLQYSAPNLYLHNQMPPLVPSKDVLQEAYFPVSPATWNTGMQWHFSWRLPHTNKGTVTFDTTMDQGLMIGFGSSMSDTGGGTIVHLLAPTDEPDTFAYGVSDMSHPGKMHVFKQVQRSKGEPKKQRFRVSYDNGHYEVSNDEGPIFAGQYPFYNTAANAPQQNIRFFGFGTSSVGNVRTIDAVQISK